jgi:hypothetical protein
MPSNKTIKRKSRSKPRSSSKSRSKPLFNKLLRSLNNSLIKQAIQFNEYSNTINNNFLLSLTKTEKSSIEYYQNNSSLINGFLRKGYQFFSEFNKGTILNSLGKSSFNSSVKELIKKINSIDKIFTKGNCTKTTQSTILYRGSDKLYPGINKAYTSCSKSIEALFEMKFVKGDVNILSNDCCINVLIIDENIPYLDLENNSERWKYQEEVLLPRGLNSEIIEETIIKYNSLDFKVYIMRVMLSNNETVYNIPELPKDDSVDMKNIKFIIDQQRSEIINLSNMFIDKGDWTDEKEDINELIEYIYDLKKKGNFTQEDYSKICKKILNTLKTAISGMIESDSVIDECKMNLKPALDKVEEILNSEEQLITPERFVEVKKC